MKKNGFTLIELLAVIVILSILALITTVSYNKIINSSKNNLSDVQKHYIEEAAETYNIKEGMNTNISCVNVSYLIENGYMSKNELKDPKTKQNLTGSVIIGYASNQYTYTYQTDSCPEPEENE